MRIPVFVAIASVLLLLTVSTQMPQSTRAATQAPKFSSDYTPLTKCGSGMTKKEEREAEEHGSDIPTVCKGPDGYKVDISYSACSSSFSITKGEENISLGMQSVDWKQKTAEWRLANGKPFAIIIRMYDYAG